MLALVWHVPELGPVTLIEAAWLLAGVLALAVCVPHLPALWRDWRVAVWEGRPALIGVARGSLRREILRVSFGLTITAIGMLAAAQSTPGPARITEVGLVLTAGLLWLGYGNALMSWWDWRDRVEIERALEEESRQTKA